MAEVKKYTTDRVYEDLFHLLMNGNYAPGDKLPSENELKQRFNVSRNTIRAALNRMNVLGIIETHQGDGSYLKGFGTELYLNSFVPSILSNTEDLMGLMEFRRGVEVSSARLAAIHASTKDLEDLEQYFEYLEGKDISNKEFAESTSEFHLKIAVASKNDMLVRILELIRWIITSRMADFLVYKPNVADSSYYHYMIFRCIKQRKPEEAAFMMDCHMKLLIQRVESFLEDSGVNSEKQLELQKPIRVTNIFERDEETHHDPLAHKSTK